MLRQRILIACLLALAVAAPQAAQARSSEDVRLPSFLQPPDVKQSVLLDLSESGYGGIGAIYDYALGMGNSLHAGLSATGAGTSNNYWTAVGLRLGYSWWIQRDFWPHVRKPLLGWFAGPVLRVDAVNWHVDWGTGSANTNATYVGGGGQGGYQWVFRPGLTARLFADAGFMAGNLASQYGNSIGYGGPYVGGHGAVGWSF